jgi:hypothetical protein
MHEDIQEAIREFAATGDLIAIHYFDQRGREFYAGIVESVENEEFELRYVNPFGFPGGKGTKEHPSAGWFEYVKVKWVAAKTPYLVGLARLSQNCNKWRGQKEAEWTSDSSSFRRHLSHCLKTKSVCSIRFDGGDETIAIVNGMSDDRVALTQLDQSGRPIGEKLIYVNSLDAVRVGGLDEVTMTFLADV